MNGYERILRTLAGVPTDRIPVALHNFLMAAQMSGLHLDRYCQSGELLAKAQINAWEYFCHDMLQVENGVAAMAQAVGCEVAYASNQPPHVLKPMIESLDDIDKLKVPDPQATFPLNEILRAIRLIKKHVGKKAFLVGRADQGPMALACALYGPERLLLEVASGEAKKKIHNFLEFCVRCTSKFASALHKAGADGTCIGGMGLSVISPDIYNEYEWPWQKIFVENCHNEDFLVGIHTCGHEDKLLPMLVATGADWLELDSGTTPAKACVVSMNKCGILGMIDPTGTLLNGSVEEVKRECTERIRQMSSSRFILGPGCVLPKDCRVENVHALIDSAHQYVM